MSALQPQPTDKHASWAWSESRATEDDVVLRARERAAELDVPPVSEGTAALLTVLAATRAPAAVVEVGTGAGVSGLAASGDPRADAVLSALSDGRLLVSPDKTLLIRQGNAVVEAKTGAPAVCPMAMVRKPIISPVAGRSESASTHQIR